MSAERTTQEKSTHPNDEVWAERLFRAGFITAALLAAVLARLDRAVEAATKADWLPASERSARASADIFESFGWCQAQGCTRLPGAGVLVYVLIGLLLAACSSALLYAYAQKLQEPAKRAWMQFFKNAAILALALGLVATILRFFYARGLAPAGSWAIAASAAQLAVLLGGAVLVTRVHFGAVRGAAGPWAPVRELVGRHWLQIALVAAYALLVHVVPTSSEQFFDALRAIDLASSRGVSAYAFLLFSALLLALVLYEGGLRLEADARVGEADAADALSWRNWLLLCASVTVVGALGAFWFLGWALFALGIILFGLAGLEALKPNDPPAVPETSGDCTCPKTSGEPAEAPKSGRLVASMAAAPLLTLAAAQVAAAVDVVVVEGKHPGPISMLLGGAALLAVVAYAVSAPSSPQLPGGGRLRVGIRPLTAVALAAFGVVGLLLILGRWTVFPAIAGVTLTAALLGYVVVVRKGWRGHAATSIGWSIPAALATGVAVMVAVHLKPIGTALAVGTVGLANLAAVMMAGLLFLVAMMVRGYRPPTALQWLGLRRAPVLSIIVVWALIAGALAPSNLNDVRLVSRNDAAATPTLSGAFDAWLAAQPEFERAQGGFDNREGVTPGPVPLVLVASHGGGIRAAYWTALVMDCVVGVSAHPTLQPLDERDLDESRARTCSDRRRTLEEARVAAGRVFLGSGVSGGGVGLAAYAQELLSGGFTDSSWVDSRLGGDLLAPTVGWGLFHDLPNHFLGISPGEQGRCQAEFWSQCLTQDRAAVLEQAFDQAGGGDAYHLRSSWYDRESKDPEVAARARSVPLLAINSSTPHSGLRAVASPADLGTWPSSEGWDPPTGESIPRPLAGTADVVDMLCGRWDMRVSTAAFLGARFPLVSPAGRVEGNCGVKPGAPIPKVDYGTPCATADTFCETLMVDGGYVDNSGLLTIALLWPELRRQIAAQNMRTPQTPIAVVVLDIDSHYQDDVAFRQPTGHGPQALIPGTTLLGASAAIESAARGAVHQAHPTTCFVTVAPQVHPGLTAPLGWTLSEASETDLRNGLVRAAPAAAGASTNWPVYRLRRLQAWLDPAGSPPQFTPELASCVPTM